MPAKCASSQAMRSFLSVGVFFIYCFPNRCFVRFPFLLYASLSKFLHYYCYFVHTFMLLFISIMTLCPGCIPCISHSRGTPLVPQVYANVEGWRTPEVQRSEELCVEVCILIGQHAKEYNLGYIHVATPTGKLTPRRRSLFLSALFLYYYCKYLYRIKFQLYCCFTNCPVLTIITKNLQDLKNCNNEKSRNIYH